MLFFLLDDKRLLHFVPQKYRKSAKSLLQHFNSRPNEVTYDSSGVIYIDTVAIPHSDIFVYFPYLFKAKHRKNLIGFSDFKQKIIDIGLSNLIFKSERNFEVRSYDKKHETSTNDKEINWWFID